jgi:hypothetical protein
MNSKANYLALFILYNQLMDVPISYRFGQRPDGYSPASYTNEFGDLLKAVDADSRIPVKNNLVGPSIGSGPWSPEQVWQTGFIDKFKDRLRALTVQK